MKELISREFKLKELIDREFKEEMVTLESTTATITGWTASSGSGFLPHKHLNINLDGTGPVKFNLN